MTTLSARLGPAVATPPGAALFQRLRTFAAFFTRDPRHYQMTAQALLYLGGVAWLDFEVPLARAVLTLSTTIGTQWACTVIANQLGAKQRFEWRSALISGTGLCLLLRTDSLLFVIATAALAIASKFLFRVRGKHVFNPTCFALAVMMLLTPHVWLSPGQWGQATLFAFAIAGLGSLIVTRAARADTVFAFLGAWGGIVFGRAAWLGQPWITPLHMISNGAILLFAFFMISDPRTTPDTRLGRVIFATVVAIGAGIVQFVFFRTNGPLWSLAACAIVVPLLDRWLPGARHTWTRDGGSNRTGDLHAASLPARA